MRTLYGPHSAKDPGNFTPRKSSHFGFMRISHRNEWGYAANTVQILMQLPCLHNMSAVELWVMEAPGFDKFCYIDVDPCHYAMLNWWTALLTHCIIESNEDISV